LLTNALRVTFQPDPAFAQGRIEARAAPNGASGQQQAGSAPADMTHTMMAPPPAQPAQATPIPRGAAGSIPPAWLTLLKPSRGEPFRLDRPLITIGRGDTNDIVINEKRVSRAHAEIRYDRGAFTLHDQASQNGVYLNGARITRPAPLKDRDLIMICGYEFIFQRR
jgi:pSer/pThr/pTyr-binding forkhead associated (FHA) protein